MMRILFFFSFTFLLLSGKAQDKAYVHEMIDSLCAPRYHGRGYVENGDVKAGDFLIRQCKEIGLKPLEGSHEQWFELGVNTFPGTMQVIVNKDTLETGIDYIIEPRSIAQEGQFKAFRLKPKHVKSPEKIFKLSEKEKVNESVVVIDGTVESNAYEAFLSRIYDNPLRAQGYVLLTDKKLTWSVGRSMLNSTVVRAQKNDQTKRIRKVSLDIDQEWKANYQTKNIMAVIPGKKEKMVVYTAHYDHLGRMGADTYIAGASDNASGSAMLLDLAKYYQKNQPEYTTVFIWFAGEEAGLVGSKYFVENSPIQLDQIKFLLNLDLMADAKKGITVVNGKIFNEACEDMVEVNEKYALLDEVKARGSAANSDHFPFYEKGVPSFFIYTMGDYKHYHDVHDVPENIPLTNYEAVFKLITEFVETKL